MFAHCLTPMVYGNEYISYRRVKNLLITFGRELPKRGVNYRIHSLVRQVDSVADRQIWKPKPQAGC